MSTSSGPQALRRELYPLVGQSAWRHSALASASPQPAASDGAREISLDGGASKMTIGRSVAADIIVNSDPTVSRLHAILERVGGCWIIVDDGLSKNGTFVNGERVGGRRKLGSGDTIRVGRSVFVFRADESFDGELTLAHSPLPTRSSLTPAQYVVLEALCRPYDARDAYSYPASNRQIADDLCLSLSTVKTHMRALFRIFQVEALPPNQKRLFLVERAIEFGIVADQER
ncbi:FHA domain-containing protein [Nocardia implantans]|uniref:FHA domain-containing protein n=1 Tax=Nocardia implantans TaxID=3108168 RepID=A0ABU6ATP9_9NOCA|nr:MULTISPECIES: FHA domain-containing protein [unclassified Nocardia]MBF6191141.1 FHA domain-containing protein [Nocardia beijingensis]MEA3529140.1 FHA domain-containing protein [Nocardia sp. CDC192]MEB3510805.1 FHA domain-containing protein [Nocardia sp. CDC186]